METEPVRLDSEGFCSHGLIAGVGCPDCTRVELEHHAKARLDELIDRKVTEGHHYRWWIDLHEHADEIVKAVLG